MSKARLELPDIDVDRFSTLKRIVTDDASRFVVSLGGGAIPGICGNLALVFLLEKLELVEHVEEVWGTSAGAVVGGGMASGNSAHGILEELVALGEAGAVDVGWWRLAFSFLMRPFGGRLPDGIVYGRRFETAIDNGLRCERIEDCPIQFRCIAVSDDGTMSKRVFRRGKLLPAIFASMSIPGVVVPRPIEDDGKTYYDGGLLEKTPLISPVAEHNRLGTDQRLLLLCTHFDSGFSRSTARGFLARFLQTIYALEDLAWGYQLEEVRRRDEVTMLLANPKLSDKSLFNFSRVYENVEAAYARFADLLQNAKIGHTFGLS